MAVRKAPHRAATKTRKDPKLMAGKAEQKPGYPPTDISAADLVTKLQQYPTPSDVVDFPRKIGGRALARCRIRVLNHVQQAEARFRGVEALKKKGYTVEDLQGEIIASVERDFVACETLAMTLQTVDPISGSEGDRPTYGMLFVSGAQVSELCTGDEVGTLFTAYNEVQARYGPYEGSITTDDQLNAWIKRLVEGGSAHPLAFRSSLQLIELATLLAERSYTLSAILDSQLKNSVNISSAALATLDIGTSYYTRRPLRVGETGLSLGEVEPLENDEDVPDDELPLTPSETITIEQAAAILDEVNRR